jgi:prephenate dehydrogenase
MHPLFGPESASSGLSGHKLIFCDSSLSIKATAKIKKCLSGMGLDVIDMSAEDHDKQMATLQALTFFLARSLNEFGIHNNKLITPSFQRLIDLAELDKKHSDELLQTIWQGNRHAKKVRQKFMHDIQALDKKIG